MQRAPILYWFPGCLEIPAEHAGRFEGRKYLARGQGPEKDRDGLLATPFRADAVLYEPHLQRWDRLADNCWIGCLRGVAPDAFRREQTRAGYLVPMGDGQRWQVPVANPFLSTCALPRWDVLGPSGWTAQVQDQFSGLADRAAEAAAKMREAALFRRELELEEDWLRQLMADALAVNYDLTMQELSVLRVFSAESLANAIRALVDWPEMERVLMMEIQSRGQEAPAVAPFGGTAPDAGKSTLPGAVGSCQDTPQPASTSTC
jgi:hypothetical protein